VPRNEVNGDVYDESVENLIGTNRVEVQQHPIPAGSSQSELQPDDMLRRPARAAAARPSRFRDDRFETQFRPGSKNKVRQMHFNPGKGEPSAVDNVCSYQPPKIREQECQDLGKGEQRRDNSPQTGQTGGPLTWQTKCSPQRCRTNVCKDHYVRGKYPSLIQDPGPRLSWPTWPKTRLKNHRPNQWKTQLRMLNQRSIRFKPPKGSRKLSREAFQFRTLSRRCPIRFRTRYQQNTTVYNTQQQLLWPCTVKQAGKLAQGSVRFRALSRHSIRFRPSTGSCKLSRGAFRVRMLNRCSTIRFRTQYHPNTAVYKKQQQLLRSGKTEQKYPLNNVTFRFRMLKRSSSIPSEPGTLHVQPDPVPNYFLYGKPDIQKMFASGDVKDRTRYIHTAILHSCDSDWSQKSAKEEALRNHHGLSAINHKLSNAFHSTGAQIQQQSISGVQMTVEDQPSCHGREG